MEENSQNILDKIVKNDIVENSDDIQELQGEAYGDHNKLQIKSENLKIGFININGVPEFNLHQKELEKQ